MTRSGSPSSQSFAGTRADPGILALLTGVIVLGTVAAALATGQWTMALLGASLFTICVTAVNRPRPYRIAGLVAVTVTPFAAAFSVFRPEDFNYAFSTSLFLLLLVFVGLLQPRAYPRTLGSLYLTFVALAAVVGVVTAFGPSAVNRTVYILMGLAVYVLLWRADRAERELMLRLIIVFAVVQSILAVAQAWFGWPVFSSVLPALLTGNRNYFAYLLPGVTSTVTQGSGTFAHFNFLGAVLALAVPLALGMWLQRFSSVLRALAFVVCVAGLIATFSRGALLGAALGTVLILFMQPSRGRRTVFFLVVCAAVLVALLAVNTAAQYYETTENVGIRMSTWQQTLGQAVDTPSSLLFGYGYDHYRGRVLAAGRGGETLTVQSTVMASLHSGYVQLLLEFGVVAAVLFGLWLISFTRTALRTVDKARAATLLGAGLGFLVHQAVDNAMFSYAGVLFIAVIAVLEADTDQADHDQSRA